jgi:hypothetical protein
MGSISPDFFLVNNRLRDEKLLRLESRLVEASENEDRAVGGRLGMSAGLGGCSGRSNAGDMAPSRLDIEPFGVLRFLLGKRPNWAVCRDDMEDTERGDGKPGDMADAPDTEEYAESLPVKGGLYSPFCGLADECFVANELSSVDRLNGEDTLCWCPKRWFVRLESACGVAPARCSSLCQTSR